MILKLVKHLFNISIILDQLKPNNLLVIENKKYFSIVVQVIIV